MNNPIVLYRLLLTLVTMMTGAALVAVNRHLPADWQMFAWGVATGLLATFGYLVATWVVDLSIFLLIPIIPAISAALRYAFGFSFGSPRDTYFWLGEGLGLAIMIAISLVMPLRRLSQAPRPQARRMPPMEESSSHKMVLPRASDPRSDKPRSG